jgi:hypothetical protein
MAEDEQPTSTKGNFITKKLGPLPLWAWAAIAAGSLGALYILHRGSSGSTAGTMAGQPGSAGVTSGDPLTLSQLSQELATLNTTLQGQLPTQGGLQRTPSLGQVSIRNPTTSGQYAAWDSTHAGVGASTTPGPGGNIIVPWDTLLSWTGQSERVGTNVWYEMLTPLGLLWIADRDLSFTGTGVPVPTQPPPISAAPPSFPGLTGNLRAGANAPTGLFPPSPLAGTAGSGTHLAGAAVPKVPTLGGHG